MEKPDLRLVLVWSILQYFTTDQQMQFKKHVAERRRNQPTGPMGRVSSNCGEAGDHVYLVSSKFFLSLLLTSTMRNSEALHNFLLVVGLHPGTQRKLVDLRGRGTDTEGE